MWDMLQFDPGLNVVQTTIGMPANHRRKEKQESIATVQARVTPREHARYSALSDAVRLKTSDLIRLLLEKEAQRQEERGVKLPRR